MKQSRIWGQSHIHSSQMDAKILIHLPTALSVIFDFQAKIYKALFWFNRSVSPINISQPTSLVSRTWRHFEMWHISRTQYRENLTINDVAKLGHLRGGTVQP